jgi:hypothetical protein
VLPSGAVPSRPTSVTKVRSDTVPSIVQRQPKESVGRGEGTVSSTFNRVVRPQTPVEEHIARLSDRKLDTRVAAVHDLGRLGRDAVAAIPHLRRIADQDRTISLAIVARNALGWIARDHERYLAETTRPVSPRPRWDASSGRLHLGYEVKVLPPYAHEMRVILDAFQSQRWPVAVDNPLPGDGRRARQRLRRAVEGLNQDLATIRFVVGVTGDRIVALRPV